MMEDVREFLRRGDVVEALADWAEVCLNRVCRDEEDFFPDPAQYLRDEGIRVPEGTGLRLIHTIQEGGSSKQLDGDEEASSVPACEVIEGKRHCFSVCSDAESDGDDGEHSVPWQSHLPPPERAGQRQSRGGHQSGSSSHSAHHQCSQRGDADGESDSIGPDSEPLSLEADRPAVDSTAT